MLTLLFSKDPKYNIELCKWVTGRLFMTRVLRDGDYSTIAVAEIDPVAGKSKIIAGILYHDYCPLGDGGKIEMSMYAESPKWAQPGIIRALLHYPFIQLKCHIIVCTTTRTNRRTRRFLEGIGFKERGTLNNRPYADDTIIYALRREDAERRLIPPIHAKEAA